MQVYRYRAFSKQGDILQGTLLALSVQEVSARLQRRELELISCHKAWIEKIAFLYSPRHQEQELLSFCFYLRYFLEAGFSLNYALQTMQGTFRGFFQGVIGAILEDIQRGSLFSQALQKQAPFMGPVLINLITTGEKSGRMCDALGLMIQNLHDQHEVRKSLGKALRYPITLFCLLGCVLGVLFATLVPSFITFFQSTQFSPTWETKLLISLYRERWFWGGLFLGCLGMIGVLTVLSKNSHIQYKTHQFINSIPYVGGFWLKLNLRPFLQTWVLLLQAKTDILEALKIASYSLESAYLKQKLEHLIQDIQHGQNLSKAFQRTHLLPDFFIRMVQLGEETGKLAQSMEQLNHLYKQELEEKLEKYIAAIEPLLLGGVGLILIWLISALFMPLYENLSCLQEVM